MSMVEQVSEEVFRELLQEKLEAITEETWNRALGMFRGYGPSISWDVTNVLLQACDQGLGKVEAVLSELEKFFREELQFQCPIIRGRVISAHGHFLHERVFMDICTRVLNLNPA